MARSAMLRNVPDRDCYARFRGIGTSRILKTRLRLSDFRVTSKRRKKEPRSYEWPTIDYKMAASCTLPSPLN